MKRKPIESAAAVDDKADWVEDILNRAQKGDRSVLPTIQQVLKSPELAEMLGNLARRVQITVVESVTGGNVAMSEGLNKKLDAMRVELAGPDPTPLERQLVERIVLCWLAVHDAELRAALATSISPEQGDYWQRRIDHAHKRHLSAIKTLAMIRKMAVPIIIGQLNVARRQVNTVECGSKSD